MTVKTPQKWQPQPIGFGNETLSLVQAANNLVDQLSNQLVDQLGNSLVTGTNIPQHKIAIAWSQTGV
jgi:hypothetical protein